MSDNNKNETKLTNQNLYDLQIVLNNNDYDDYDPQYLIHSAVILDKIGARIKQLENIKAESKEFRDYQGEKASVFNKYCEKKDGQLVLYADEQGTQLANSGNGYPKATSSANKKKLNTEIDELAVKYKGAIDKQRRAMVEYRAKLEDKVEPALDLPKIPANLIPKFNKANAIHFYKILYPIIKID